MLDIGSIVSATVVRVEDFGIFLKSGDAEIFVDHGELRWPSKFIQSESPQAKDCVAVKILRMNYGNNVYAGSLKRVNADDSPYVQLSRHPVGKVLHGTIIRVVQNHAWVEMENGALALIEPSSMRGISGPWPQGVDVNITSLDPDHDKLFVKPV